MRARQNTGFDPDLADLVEGASVRTALVIDHLIAENTLTQCLVILFQLGLGGCIVFGDGSLQLFLQSADEFVAFGFRMLLGIESVR